MTREQKALAAFGSSVGVGLLLMARWSILGGLVFAVLGLCVTVAGLRVTHPKGSARPTLAGVGLLGAPARPTSPRTEEDIAAQRAELERRRLESERRAAERAERRRHTEALREERRREREAAAARRDAARHEREAAERVERERREAQERARVEEQRRAREAAERAERDRQQLEAAITDTETATDEGILAASQMAALDDDSDLDEAQRQRVYLLNKVRLKLSDYE